MSITKTITESLEETKSILLQFDDTMYQKQLAIISEGTIGKHFRHIIEFYFCLFDKNNDDYISYDERKRNLLWETSIKESIAIIDFLIENINTINLGKNIVLKQSYYNETFNIPTTYQRELIYCFDHSIHHFALIRIAIENSFPTIVFSKDFGIAPSTIAYQNLTHASKN
ncbi:hypothetical protein [Chishuiella sp.]|uniref:hypothetical protein n=1 Tax=Chishuiella sp. TaxID=1969467 RepID=UPI0028ACE22F|nr:hypothetical protein [Chishuiella sp.]